MSSNVRRFLSVLLPALAMVGCFPTDNAQTPMAPPATASSPTAIRSGTSATLNWKISDVSTVSIYASTDPFDIQGTGSLVGTSTGSSFVATGLDTTRRLYWKIVPAGGTGVGVSCRHMDLAGCMNFRDIGGYPTSDGKVTRWGLVFRSDALTLKAADRRFVDSMGVRVDIDLRAPSEISATPDSVGSLVQYDSIPYVTDLSMFPASLTNPATLAPIVAANHDTLQHLMTAFYLQLLDQHAARIGKVFTLMAQTVAARHSVVFHCTAGKDRAGVTSALLLNLLGVSDSLVTQDFLLTNTYTQAKYAPYYAGFKQAGIDSLAILPLFGAAAPCIQATLAHLKSRYGSAESFLEDRAGVSVSDIAALKAALKE